MSLPNNAMQRTARRAAAALAALVTLGWSSFAFCDEIQNAPRVSQDASGTKSATAQSTPSSQAPPPAAPAVIFVYRKARVLGKMVRTVIFVNHQKLGELHNSQYVRTEVPAGKVEVIATGGYTGHRNLDSAPTPAGWSSLPGCAALDWRGVFWAPPSDIQLCLQNLNALEGRCGASIVGIPPSRTIRIPACNSELTGADAARDRLILAKFELRTSIEAEAGHTYYLRYMIKLENQIPNQLELVDAAIGAKEMKGDQLAKD